MNDIFTEAFSQSFLDVLPQLGVAEVAYEGKQEYGKKIESPGVVVIIGIIGDLKGNVIFSMREDCGKMIASSMMGGMEVESFDKMAQSAISELCNMLVASACTNLSQGGISADISTPTLVYGDFTAAASYDSVMRMDFHAGEFPVSIYISLKQQ